MFINRLSRSSPKKRDSHAPIHGSVGQSLNILSSALHFTDSVSAVMISSRQWPATKGIEQNLAILDCYARRPFISPQIFLWADRWAFWIRYSSVVTWLLLLCSHFLSGCAVHCLSRAEELRLCCRLQTSSHTACQAISESMNCFQSSLPWEPEGRIENNKIWVLLRGAHWCNVIRLANFWQLYCSYMDTQLWKRTFSYDVWIKLNTHVLPLRDAGIMLCAQADWISPAAISTDSWEFKGLKIYPWHSSWPLDAV